MELAPDLAFYSRDSLVVARDLLGAYVSTNIAGTTTKIRITEVEAYRGSEDPGSHAYRGRTKRTEVMFGPAGHLYVYFTYGMHWCMNIVTGKEGSANAVLLRGGEIVSGIEAARIRRPSARRDTDLARGPARFTTALGLDGTANGMNLLNPKDPVTVTIDSNASDAVQNEEVATGPRVGVSGPGGDGDTYPWRLWISGEPTVSQYRPGKPRKRKKD